MVSLPLLCELMLSHWPDLPKVYAVTPPVSGGWQTVKFIASVDRPSLGPWQSCTAPLGISKLPATPMLVPSNATAWYQRVPSSPLRGITTGCDHAPPRRSEYQSCALGSVPDSR